MFNCTGSRPWSSHDGPVYRDVVWYEAGFIPCLFSASSWRALGAQGRSCEGRSLVPRWGGSRTQPRTHLARGYMCPLALRLALCPGHAGHFHTLPRTAVPSPHPGRGAPVSARGKRWCFVPQLAPAQRLIAYTQYTQGPFSTGRGG